MTIGTIEVHLNISSAEQLDRLIAALKEVEHREPVAPAVVDVPAVEPETAVAPTPKARATRVKANGPEPSPVTIADTSKAPPETEPLSRDDVRAQLGLYASKHGMAAAVAIVKSQGVDHLDALAVEKLPELAAQLDIPPEKAS